MWGRERKEREKEGRFFKQNQKSCTNIVLCVCVNKFVYLIQSEWTTEKEERQKLSEREGKSEEERSLFV